MLFEGRVETTTSISIVFGFNESFNNESDSVIIQPKIWVIKQDGDIVIDLDVEKLWCSFSVFLSLSLFLVHHQLFCRIVVFRLLLFEYSTNCTI